MRTEFIQICPDCKKPFKWYGYPAWKHNPPLKQCNKCMNKEYDNFIKVIDSLLEKKAQEKW